MQGYMKNARGHWVENDNVAAIDKLRDELVRELVGEGLALQLALREYKRKAFDRIASFIELSAAEYDVVMGGKKGNVTLVSYDGEYRISRTIAEHLEFDERLQVAKELIDQCLTDWSADAGPELRQIVTSAFDVDRKGTVRTQAILALRKFDFDDERWKRAMEAIADGLSVVGSKSYIRIQKRQGEEYIHVPLDLARV